MRLGCSSREPIQGLPFGSKDLDVARRHFRQVNQATCQAHQLCGYFAPDGRTHVGGSRRHPRLHIPRNVLLALVHRQGKLARFHGLLIIRMRQRLAAGRGGCNGHHHDGRRWQHAIQVDLCYVLLIPDGLDHPRIINGVVHQRLQLRELEPVFIADEVVNDHNLIVNLYGQLVALHEELLLRVVCARVGRHGSHSLALLLALQRRSYHLHDTGVPLRAVQMRHRRQAIVVQRLNVVLHLHVPILRQSLLCRLLHGLSFRVAVRKVI
mmetsp:Transcript_17184/g.44086  ORF Transcript_17184/g.44086 Transcript_17184/m.44086 type:complete len:266 (-) Transcript_17184:101-898(-)